LLQQGLPEVHITLPHFSPFEEGGVGGVGGAGVGGVGGGDGLEPHLPLKLYLGTHPLPQCASLLPQYPAALQQGSDCGQFWPP